MVNLEVVTGSRAVVGVIDLGDFDLATPQGRADLILQVRALEAAARRLEAEGLPVLAAGDHRCSMA